MNRTKKSLLYFTLFFTFLLGSYKGYIALWKEGRPNPIKVFPYQTTMLPPADRQALEKGILIADGTELARLLEDYLS